MLLSRRPGALGVRDAIGILPAARERPVGAIARSRHPHPSVGSEMPCRSRSCRMISLQQLGLLDVVQSSLAQRHDLCGPLPFGLLVVAMFRISSSTSAAGSAVATGPWPRAASSSSTSRLFMAGSSNSSISRSKRGRNALVGQPAACLVNPPARSRRSQFSASMLLADRRQTLRDARSAVPAARAPTDRARLPVFRRVAAASSVRPDRRSAGLPRRRSAVNRRRTSRSSTRNWAASRCRIFSSRKRSSPVVSSPQPRGLGHDRHQPLERLARAVDVALHVDARG